MAVSFSQLTDSPNFSLFFQFVHNSFVIPNICSIAFDTFDTFAFHKKYVLFLFLG